MTAVDSSPFREVEARYADLLARYQIGELAADVWAEEAAKLNCTDASGTWWQLSTQSGHWLRWDGQQWLEDEPPTQLDTRTEAVTPALDASAPGAPSGILGEIISGVATTTIETGKSTPRMLLRYFLARLPIMGLTFGSAWLYHTYLLVFPNGGFNPDTELSKWINVQGNAASASVIWGCGSALLWSLVYSIFSVGPMRAIQNLVAAPQRLVQMVRSSGRGGIGAMLVGCGLALALSQTLRINQTASFTAAGVLTLMGLSQPGWLISSFVTNIVQAVLKPFTKRAEGALHLDPSAAQQVVTGLGPGFMLAGMLGADVGHVLGIGLAVGGLFLWLTGRGGRASVGEAAAMLIAGTLGATLYWLLEHLLADTAHADDGGASECNKRNMVEYMAGREECAGSDTALNNGLGPATSSAVTTLTPPLDQEQKVTTLRLVVQPAVIAADGRATAVATASIVSTDPSVTPADLIQGVQFGFAGEAAGWISRSEMVIQGDSASISIVALAPREMANTPGQYPVTVGATAPGVAGVLSDAQVLTLTVGGNLRITMRILDGKSELRPDGKDSLYVYARVEAPADQPADAQSLDEARSTLQLDAGTGGDWIVVSQAGVEGDESYVQVWTVDPELYRGEGRGAAPSTAGVVATARYGEIELREEQTFTILPMPELDAKPDPVELLGGSKDAIEIVASVENGGTEQWTFTCEFGKDDPVVAVASEPEQDGPAQARITVTEASGDSLSAASNGYASATMRIFAEQGTTKLERDVKVLVAQAGLQVVGTGRSNEDNSFRLLADGDTTREVDFIVFVWDEAANRLVSDTGPAQSLQFSIAEGNDERIRNALTVGEVMPNIKFDRIRPSNVPTAVYTFTTTRVIPADTPVLLARLEVTVPDQTKPEYTKSFLLGLQGPTGAPMSPDWQIELQRCEEIIYKYAPTQYYGQLKDILDRRKMLLGADGLYRFRHQIWSIIVNLTLAEGDRGWEEVDKWASRITTVLEWTQWAGDLAFDAWMQVALGPIGQAAAPMAKNLVISCLNDVYQDGQPLEDWFKGQVFGLFLIPGAILTDPVVLQQTFEKSPTTAWAIYLAYQVGSNLAQGQSLKDAALNAARAARDQVISTWLCGKVQRSVPGGAHAPTDTHVTETPWTDQSRPPTRPDLSPPPRDVPPPERPPRAPGSGDGPDGPSRPPSTPEGPDGTHRPPAEPQAPHGTRRPPTEPEVPEGTRRPPSGPDGTRRPPVEPDGPDGTRRPPTDGDGADGTRRPPTDGDGADGTRRPPTDGDGPDGTRRPPTDGDGPDGTRRPPADGDGPDGTRRPPADGDGADGTRRPPADGDGPDGTRRPPTDGDGPDGTRRPPPDGDGADGTRQPPTEPVVAPPGQRTPDPGRQPRPPSAETASPQQKVKNLTEGITRDANGNPRANLEDVLTVQRDTRATRSLKHTGQSVKDGFNNTLRGEIYAPHDRIVADAMTEYVRKNIPGMQDVRNPQVRVDEFRTPGAKGNPLNTDRDYRVLYLNKKGQWIEIPKEAWQDLSYKAFADLSGYSPDRLRGLLTPDEARMWDRMDDASRHELWAAKHGQLATDKFSREASPDYADQARNPRTGEVERVTPNIIRVEHGVGTLKDPDALGNMYYEKVNASLRQQNPAEAVAQAKKGVDTIDKVRNGYEMQGYKTGDVPDNIKNGMELIKRAPVDERATPQSMQQLDAQLRGQGFDGLSDFMNKLGGQFSALKFAEK